MEDSASSPVLFDSHMHTPLCRHAYGHPREYAHTAKARGLRGIVFTCHSPMPNGFSANVRMMPEQFDDYVHLVENTAWELEDSFIVRLGMESDWFPGMEDWLTELHGRAHFHYIIGSVHYHTLEYQERFYDGDFGRFQEGYFGHLADSAESGLFDALGHSDLIKNADPAEWNLERLWPSIEAALDRIAATGVAMELNTSGLNKSFPEMNPGLEMLTAMARRGIPVVLGSDSHTPERVGADFEFALDELAHAGFDEIRHYEDRKPVPLKIAEVRDSLRGTTMSSGSMV